MLADDTHWRKFIPLNAERPFADNGIDRRHNGFELNILSLRPLPPIPTLWVSIEG